MISLSISVSLKWLRKQNVDKNSWEDKISLLKTNLPSVVIPNDGTG